MKAEIIIKVEQPKVENLREIIEKKYRELHTKRKIKKRNEHCVKSVRIRSFSGLYFPVFGLNMEIYSGKN